MLNILIWSLIFGVIAGILEIVYFRLGNKADGSAVYSLLKYIFISVIIFHSDLPYLPWWAQGGVISLAFVIPALVGGKSSGSPFSALLRAAVLGSLLSLAVHFVYKLPKININW